MTQNNAQAAPGPRATHYVSLTNGGIYPAMTAPLGHEDANPADWRAATPQEIQRYQQGQQAVDVSPIHLGESPIVPAGLSTPAALTLAADDAPPVAPVVPVAPIAEAPVVSASVSIPSPAPTAAPAPVAPPAAPTNPGVIQRAPSAE